MSSIINSNNIIQSPLNKSRKDKFIIVFSIPKALQSSIANYSRDNQNIIPKTFQFAIYGAVVPKIEIPAVTIPYSGQNLSVTSYTRTPYEKLSIKFNVDNRFNNYWVINKWLNLLNDEKQSVFDFNNLSGLNKTNNSEVEKQYMTNLSIFGLDEYNKRTIEFQYTNAFPTLLGGIDYNHQDESEIECSAEFAYSQLITNLNTNVENA